MEVTFLVLQLSNKLNNIRNEIQMQKPFGNVSLILSYNNKKVYTLKKSARIEYPTGTNIVLLK